MTVQGVRSGDEVQRFPRQSLGLIDRAKTRQDLGLHVAPSERRIEIVAACGLARNFGPFLSFLVAVLFRKRIGQLRGASCQHRGLLLPSQHLATCPQSLLSELRGSGEHLDRGAEPQVAVGSETELLVQLRSACNEPARIVEPSTHRLEPAEPEEEVRLTCAVAHMLTQQLFASCDRSRDVARPVVQRVAEIAQACRR